VCANTSGNRSCRAAAGQGASSAGTSRAADRRVRRSVSGEYSAFSIQLSAFSFQHSAFSIQLSAFSFQHSAFSIQLSGVSAQLSAFSFQLLGKSSEHAFDFHERSANSA
jgi:hypothetical protein